MALSVVPHDEGKLPLQARINSMSSLFSTYSAVRPSAHRARDYIVAAHSPISLVS